MNSTARKLLIIGAINGFLFVALGAFGAHGLKNIATAEQISWFKTATDYQGIHALALLVTGLVSAHFQKSRNQGLLLAAGWLFVAGILIFSGSLYAMSVGAPRWLGAITPIGGVGFLAGWSALASALIREREQ